MRAAFYKGTRPGLPGIYNRVVRTWEGGIYSHAELVFSDGLSASASFMDHGVRFKQIAFDPANWDIISLPEALEAPARAWFEAHNGQAYDLLGNLHFVVSLIRQDPNKWFCTEAMAEALGIKDSGCYGPRVLFSTLLRLNELTCSG